MRLKGHKHIKVSGVHFSHKINIFVLFFCILAAASIISFSVFAGKGDLGSGEGETDGNQTEGEYSIIGWDDSNIVPCGGGYVCYTTQNGDYSGLVWIYVPTSSATSYYNDAGAFQNVAPGSANTVVPGLGSDNNIKGCDKAGGYYVLGIMRYYKQSGESTGDVKGPFLLDQANSGGVYNKAAEAADGAYQWADGSYSVSSATAAAAFAQAQAAGYETGKSWDTGNFSAFCAWENPAEEAKAPVAEYPALNCGLVKGIEMGGSDFGNTSGDVFVKNYSSSSSMRGLIAGDAGLDQYGFMDNYIFAKPGDSIQFRHRLCSAAMNVRGTSMYENQQYNGDGVGIWSGSSARDFGTHDYGAVNYKFAISASPSKPYVFGEDANRFANDAAPGTFYNVNGGNGSGAGLTPLTNSSFDSLPANDKSTIGFQIYSPSASAGDKYRCSPIYAMTYGNGWTTPGYQVPGFISTPSLIGSCNASNNTDGNTNQVGSTISQYIYWNNIVGFVQLRGNDIISRECKYVGSECGHYQRVDDYRYSTSWNRHTQTKDNPYAYSYKEYDQVKAAAGAWGWHKAGCSDAPCHYRGCCVDRSNPYIANGNIVGYHTYGEWEGDDSCCTDNNPVVNSDPWYRPIYFYDKTVADGKKYEQDDATVYIPYNFSTNRSIGIVQQEIVYGGSSVSSHWSYNIVPKTNPYTATFDYATITPGYSKVQVVEFTLPADADSVQDGNMNAAVSDVCAYFGRTTGSADCKLIQEDNGPFNETGDYSGASYGGSATRAVPDVEVGTKYCVAIGIYPADSLNWDFPTISNLKGMGMVGGNTWNISSPVCRTIAKKPSFQVWNGGIFTPSGIVTSVSKKMVGVELGNNYDASATSVFGSWDEYLIVANGSVRGMSSAAGLGYNGNDNQNHYGFALKGGSSSDATLSSVSALTVSNVEGSIGKSGISSVTSTILTRLKARYKNIDTTNLNTGLEYWHLGNGATIGNISKGTVAPNADGSYPDNTLVIQVDGTVTITGNICYGACAGPSTKLSSYNLSSNNIAALPQILIFADNIQIAENVTRVDAWLIADQGTVDTCAGKSAPSAAECSETLVVNGPVFAQKLILNRTAGALPGGGTQEGGNVLEQDLSNDGSITPGEIFNLRADTYYWAYAQAQRYTEAVVTYMRELAPRF